MALKWIDGAEGWGDSTYASRAYADASGLSTAAARVSPGSRSWSCNGGRMQTPSLGVQNTWVLGIGMFVTGVSGLQVRFFSGGSEQCRFETENSGGLPRWRLIRGATVIATGPTFALNQWHYFEFKITTRTGTNGAYELRRNEVNELSGSGVNLANVGTDGVDSIGWGYGSTNDRFDDIYIVDSTGSTNNDFLGDVVSVHVLPAAEGHQIDFTPSSGTDNAALVDDPSTTASGADYNSSDTNGHEDYYTFGDLPATGLGTIFGIRASGSWAMESTGSRVARYRYYDGSSEYTIGGNVTAATTGIVELPQIAETNPATGVAWTKANVDAAEFGVEVVS